MKTALLIALAVIGLAGCVAVPVPVRPHGYAYVPPPPPVVVVRPYRRWYY